MMRKCMYIFCKLLSNKNNIKIEEFNCYACHTVNMCNKKCADYIEITDDLLFGE